MPFYTPLRYPGGKRRLTAVVKRLLDVNKLRDVHYAEPFAGGAAIALDLLFCEYASIVHINDLSRPVYAFWYSVLNDNADICKRIECVAVTTTEWRRQRAVYDNRDTADLGELGFATFFLNRTNRSGIVGGGVIGGMAQTGEWGLDARFNKVDLIQRIRRIGRYRNRILLYHRDARAFITEVMPAFGSNVFAFYDPPYINMGTGLYLNDYGIDDHEALAKCVTGLNHAWVVTYDYAAVGASLYFPRRRMIYTLSYSAQSRVRRREVMFFSDDLTLPHDWSCGGESLLSRAASRYPIYGTLEKCHHQARVEANPHDS